jgi:DNA-binding protein H-NS
MNINKLSPTELDELIQKANRRRKVISGKHVIKVRERIINMLSKQGLSIAEVFGSGADLDPSMPIVKVSKYKVKPKYRNPENNAQTWTGRGIKPVWFRNALASGKREQDMLIQ